MASQRGNGNILIRWPSMVMMFCSWCLFQPSFVVALGNVGSFPSPSQTFQTRSGLPVCRYALGGAARSTQPQSLPSRYVQLLQDAESPSVGAPCFFFYNPHRYPAFMHGIQELCEKKHQRENIFVMSGGTDRSPSAMEQRLKDALSKCGRDFLDIFLLEICLSLRTAGK